MSHKKITVNLKSRSYDVCIGSGVIKKIGGWLPKRVVKFKRAFIIADEKLSHARKQLNDALKTSGWEVTEITVEAGESFKNFENVYPVFGQLLKAGANRDSVLFALGGGTVGDAAGFIAATYLRGIAWVGIPTTLLAQVDSAIGGKCGINHELGKNLVGAIHQPCLVVCDTNFLSTLADRDVVSGLAEVVKTALIFDPKFYAYVEKNMPKLLDLDPPTLSYAIYQCAAWKAKVVAKDERDETGVREVLNFGHTFGHALESAGGYSYFRHGEAVIWGMRFALALSEVRKKIKPALREKIDGFLTLLAIPALPSELNVEATFEKMSLDKKVRAGKLHFVLLKAVGKCVSDNAVTPKEMREAFSLMLE